MSGGAIASACQPARLVGEVRTGEEKRSGKLLDPPEHVVL